MQMVTTHSSEQAFRACPRRYQLAYERMLRPAFDSDALRLGSAVHVGLEAAKTGGTELEAAKAVRDAYADAECPPYLEPEKFAVEQETAVALVRGWVRRYAADAVLEYVAVELSFDLPVVNPDTGRELQNHRNAGKIDAIARLPDGRLALVEHKTSGEDLAPDSDYWKRLFLDSQISRYVLAARDLGYPIDTTVYDVIRKPEIRPKAVAKADRAYSTSTGNYHGLKLNCTCPERETPPMYGARLLADIGERPDFYFARNEIPRLESDLEEFRRDQYWVLKSITACRLDDYFPRNTGACTSPYRCAYLDVCRGMRGDPHEETPAGFRVSDVPHPELALATEKA